MVEKALARCSFDQGNLVSLPKLSPSIDKRREAVLLLWWPHIRSCKKGIRKPAPSQPHPFTGTWGQQTDAAKSQSLFEQRLLPAFSDVLNETVLRTLQRERLALLDAGCGEGYYLPRLASCLRENLSEKAELYGINISKGLLTMQQVEIGTSSLLWAATTTCQCERIPGLFALHLCASPRGRVRQNPQTQRLIAGGSSRPGSPVQLQAGPL